MTEPILKVEQGTKIYGGVRALDGVDFDLRPGEIHALLGENGAGKSTLCKVMAGAVQLTSGRFVIGGREVSFANPGAALKAGIAMVYQETSLVGPMTVAQNLELGSEKFFTDIRSINIAAQQSQQSINFNVNPLALVETLGTAKRQMVEIARAVRRNAKVIIFDEPTASLTPEETQHLFTLLRRLRSEGVAIIFISHAIEESINIADRITVLRDGKLVQTAPAKDLDRQAIVRMMVGREVAVSHYQKRAQSQAADGEVDDKEPILVVENVTMGAAVKNMSFSIKPGEVLGMAGLVGAGRSEIAQIICGARKRNFLGGGRIYLRGKPIRYRTPRQAIEDGIVYITEDRKIDGFFETMTADENIYLGYLAVPRFARSLYSRRQQKKIADHWIATMAVSALKRTLRIAEYSGGNQQKVVVAKSLVQQPELVIFDEPTRGVDVGSIPHIHKCIRDLASEGKAVVVISSYLNEVLAVSDRILVARAGRIVEEFSAEDATEEKIMYAAIH